MRKTCGSGEVSDENRLGGVNEVHLSDRPERPIAPEVKARTLIVEKGSTGPSMKESSRQPAGEV
jgi:hypothetical protein